MPAPNLNLTHRTGRARLGPRDPHVEYRTPRDRRRAASSEIRALEKRCDPTTEEYLAKVQAILIRWGIIQ